MGRKRTGRPPGRPPYTQTLTPAEERVLTHLREGQPYAEIAARLGISVDAVKYHVSNMLGKLQLADRRELAAWQPPARQSGGRRWLALPIILKLTGAASAGAAVAAVGVVLVASLRADPSPAPFSDGVISVGYDGLPANGDSSEPVVSGNGRYVAFTSSASNLVPGDMNGAPDVFVFDRKQRTTERVSIGASGESNGASDHPAISADGRFIAFESSATNLGPARGPLSEADLAVIRAWTETPKATFIVPPEWRERMFANVTTLATQVYLRDRRSGETRLVSKGADGRGANLWASGASISADGRFVAFTSSATNLVPGDTNLGSGAVSEGRGPAGSPGGGGPGGLGGADAFVADTATGALRRVSLTADGGQPRGDSASAGISPDGRRIYFYSDAPNLVPNQQMRLAETGTAGPDGRAGPVRSLPLMLPFVRDLRAGTTTQLPMPDAANRYSLLAIADDAALYEAAGERLGPGKEFSTVLRYVPGKGAAEVPQTRTAGPSAASCGPSTSGDGETVARCATGPGTGSSAAIQLLEATSGRASPPLVRHSPRFSEDRPSGIPSLSQDGKVLAFELHGILPDRPPGPGMSLSEIYLVER